MFELRVGDLTTIVTVPWTGLDGTVHERGMGSDYTLCGVPCEGDSNRFHVKVACDECVRVGIREYALRHVCGVNCRVTNGPSPYELDKRVPQASEGARLDRRMSLSGRIVPLPEPCTDVDLMVRVHERLQHL